MTPSGELTLIDLILQLGVRVGTRDQGTGADNRYTPPADPSQRQLLVDAINSGRRELYSRMPEARVFQPMIEITMDPTGAAANVVDSDPSKYRLNYAIEGFAGGIFEWFAVDDEGAATGLGGQVRQTHQIDLAMLHTAGPTAKLVSWPRAVANARVVLGNPNDPGRKVVDYLWVYPKPDQPYKIRGQVRITYGPLTQNDDLEPMGQQHIESVLTFAERQYKIGRCDQAEWASIEARCASAVAVSMALDAARGPDNLGAITDPGAIRDGMKYRSATARYGIPGAWAQVGEVNGTTIDFGG